MAAVRDIMTSDVKTASPDNTLQDVARMMRDSDVGAIPVMDGDDLRGIVTDRDIVVRCVVEGMDPTDTTVGDILSTDLQTIGPDADTDDAAQMMADNQIRRLPVIEDGDLIGIITIGDLAVQPGEEDQAGQTLQDVSQGAQGGGSKSASGRQSQRGRQSQGTAQSKQRSSRSQNAKSGRMQVISGGGSRGEQGRKSQSSSRRSSQTASRSSSRRGTSSQRRAS